MKVRLHGILAEVIPESDIESVNNPRYPIVKVDWTSNQVQREMDFWYRDHGFELNFAQMHEHAIENMNAKYNKAVATLKRKNLHLLEDYTINLDFYQKG